MLRFGWYKSGYYAKHNYILTVPSYIQQTPQRRCDRLCTLDRLVVFIFDLFYALLCYHLDEDLRIDVS